MKLNLGCGKDYRDGYINCDVIDKVKIDQIVDLEKKLPFDDKDYTILEIGWDLLKLKQIQKILINEEFDNDLKIDRSKCND